MNIAMCYESLIPARGGAEVFIADLARRLVADGHEVHLYGYERDASVLPKEVVFHALLPQLAPRFLRPWRFGRACERALRHEVHDVVLGFTRTWRQDVMLPQGGVHAACARANARKYRSPWLRAVARVARWFDLAHWSYTLLERKQYAGREQPLVIASSHMVAKHFRKYYGLGPDRVRIIPNAIDTRRFCDRDRSKVRAEIRERLGIDPQTPVALFVGINYRLKGLGPLLQAVQALPALPFRLLVCGSGKIGAFKRMAHQLGVDKQVHFLGYWKEVRELFFAADFLVHPTFYDPCSLVVLEALACGLPVITSRHNGAAELLHPPHDGMVMDDPHDAPALAHALARYCDPIVRNAASQAARETAAQWTFENHYRAVIAVIEEAARRRQVHEFHRITADVVPPRLPPLPIELEEFNSSPASHGASR